MTGLIDGLKVSHLTAKLMLVSSVQSCFALFHDLCPLARWGQRKSFRVLSFERGKRETCLLSCIMLSWTLFGTILPMT